MFGTASVTRVWHALVKETEGQRWYPCLLFGGRENSGKGRGQENPDTLTSKYEKNLSSEARWTGEVGHNFHVSVHIKEPTTARTVYMEGYADLHSTSPTMSSNLAYNNY